VEYLIWWLVTGLDNLNDKPIFGIE